MVKREKSAAITVIIGNPPYNVGQKSENDNNKNRKYKVVDDRIRETYSKDSKATNKNFLSDMYVKFFRWATDRLRERDGILCFVSNNSFVDQVSFDGVRKHLEQDFERIDHIDLHGNVRHNPKLSGTTHNVFGIQIGVGITLAIKKGRAERRLRYHRVPETWRKPEKFDFLTTRKVEWQSILPDADHSWLVPAHADEYRAFASIAEMFDLYTVGVKTNRDDVVYDWDRERLAARMKKFIADYNAEAHRHKADAEADWPAHINWSRDLKQDAIRGRIAKFDVSTIRRSLYRAYTKQWLYFDSIMNEEVYKCRAAFCQPTLAICCCIDSQMPFSAQLADCVPSHAPGGRAGSASHYRILKTPLRPNSEHATRTAPSPKEDVLHYVYAILHHSGYRQRYAEHLKRELPRIPFAPDFRVFADAGRDLARLHVEYESLEPWPLERTEAKGVPYSERVTKMKLSEDKRSLRINEALTLAGIPPETFDYRLGSRSALEWVID